MFNEYLEKDEWKIIEKGFNPDNHEKSESIFSLGNGRMGQRANFEEHYSGSTLQGNYIAGIYYPDKTKVGWWKNGYPESFAKVLNSCNWIGIDVEIDGIQLDLAKLKVIDFKRVLDMKGGSLTRSFSVEIEKGKIVKVEAKRLLSLVDDEVGAIQYSITPFEFSGIAKITPYLDFDVTNADANWDNKFWEPISQEVSGAAGVVQSRTKKTGFEAAAAMQYVWTENKKTISISAKAEEKESYVASSFAQEMKEGHTYTLYKYAGVVSSLNHAAAELSQKAKEAASRAKKKGFVKLLSEHEKAWAKKWETSDISIEGDVSSQQGIRFNIFHLNQTFTGVDERLNIGPKGFTGEKYGGSTYWDTEAYCVPFYLATGEPNVAKNLLMYRYKHLQKAIENAEKLGFKNGAALFPMVTMNGEECHNEWEITFEEIHRNGAIAYAIFDYVRHTDDLKYVADFGLEVLIGIARFWAQRVNWSHKKEKYVMLGVTGPNEYENNVNNNWYTNKMAAWCLDTTIEFSHLVKDKHPEAFKRVVAKTNLDQNKEFEKWRLIESEMHFPFSRKRNIFLQQDGFLDKDLTPVAEMDLSQRPINQKWSWDRILRSAYIKQADVLQGIFFFEHQYDKATVRRNFNFYEPLTVHESSLSPCIHVILASRIGYKEKAYELYLRTSRLDLDDYNNEVAEGLHITSMAGTWMSVVQGFGGKRVIDSKLHFEPMLPDLWSKLRFMVVWKGARLQVSLDKEKMEVENFSEISCKFFVFGRPHKVAGGKKKIIQLTD